MCGIAGMVGTQPTREGLTAMAAAIRRRGPDDEGIYLGDRAGLAFRRLSILDLEGGRQPMTNEDGRIQLVFNGEIYNHLELRAELLKHGHRFVTDHSDTEVLVHGWEQWGERLFEKLNGMFAVGIWDTRERTLVLARDRYGIKPLYHATTADGGLVFGSEIKAILASGLVANRPSPEGILEYFSFQNLWRHTTMFAGVHQLEPATWLRWKDGATRKSQYWDITFPRSRKEKFEDLAAEHREVLSRSIRRQIAADVPVMSYLSGGIDSTAITVVAHQQDPRVRAYSCIFQLDGVGDDAFVDERQFSRMVAEKLSLDRVELELSQDSLIACINDYVHSIEDLRMGMGYPIYLIARRVGQDAKVVLSGTGGDEFHGGYVGRYQALGLTQTKPGELTRAGRLLASLGQEGLAQRLGMVGPAMPTVSDQAETIYRSMLNFVLKPHELASAFTPEFLRLTNGFDANEVISQFLGRCPSADWRDRVMYVDAKTYLVGLLVLEDKLSMAHSLETRVPLLDNELVDFTLDLPFEALCQGDNGKRIFRESVRPWVPAEIYSKPKMGFGPPDASWYRGALRPFIEKTLASQNLPIFQPQYIKTVLDDHFSGAKNNTYLIWSLLNFNVWSDVFGHSTVSAA